MFPGGPVRICSLLPSATEILYALGLGDDVVAVSHECDYPPEVEGKPRITMGLVDPNTLSSAEIDEVVSRALAEGHSVYRIDTETLRAAQPDVLITQELCTVCAVDGGVVRAAASELQPSPRVVSLAPKSIGDVLGSMQVVGELAGIPQRAEQVITALRRRIDAVQGVTAGHARPRVLCLEWLDPPWVAGHWMPEIVDLAGGQDVLASPGAPSRRVSWPEIVAACPEAAIVMPCGFGLERTMAEVDVLLDVPEIDQLPSFRSGCVYAVDGSSYFNRPGPRLVEGLELLAALLHPELFRGAVSPAAARKISGSLGGPGTHPKHLSFERVV